MARTVRLIHPNGCAVTVDAEKVDRLLAWGFKRPAPARRAASKRKK